MKRDPELQKLLEAAEEAVLAAHTTLGYLLRIRNTLRCSTSMTMFEDQIPDLLPPNVELKSNPPCPHNQFSVED